MKLLLRVDDAVNGCYQNVSSKTHRQVSIYLSGSLPNECGMVCELQR